MTFVKDYQFGSKYEQLFAEIMDFKNFNIATKKQSTHDILDEDTNLTYEVKADRLAFKTGNICIEYMCSDKLSGINTSTSNFYAYFFERNDKTHVLYVIPTEEIRNKIKDKLYIKDMKGGDGWRSRFYLFKLSVFEEFKL